MDMEKNADHNLIEYILSILDLSQDNRKMQMDPLVTMQDTTTKLLPLVEAVYMQTAREIKNFMDKMPGGFFIYRADGEEEIIYANQALLWMFGCTSFEEFRELTGNSFRGIVHPDDLSRVEVSIKEQIAQSQYDLDYVEYRIIQKDGEVRWVEDYGHFMRNDQLGDIFYVFLGDATEKRKRQLEEKNALLREKAKKEAILQKQIEQYDKELKVIHKEHLRRLEVIEGLSANYESILYADLDANEVLPYRMSHRIQYQFEDKSQTMEYGGFLSNYIHTWVCSEDQDRIKKATDPAYICEKLSDNKTYYVNYRVHKNEDVQYLQLRIVDAGSQQHVSQIVLGCRRVDDEIRYEMEQKKVFEDALNRAKLANIAKNTFLANMSHDMRTPMNAIIGFTALAKSHMDDAKKVGEYLEKIESSSEQLLHLINNILEISRIESGKCQMEEDEFNLFEAMQEVYRALSAQAEAKQIDFEVDVSGLEHYNVYGDERKLIQILLCLASNAVKYTKNGGHIRVTAREQSGKEEKYAFYEFDVEDNGIGIEEMYLQRIFEPFERVENTTSSGVHGTGLGLTIAKSLIEMMRGEIRVSSVPDKGSRFTVMLNFRLVNEQPASAEGNVEMVLKLLNKRKILLVDDNEINLEIASELLQDVGIAVDKAENGSVAIAKVISADPDSYGLILMDIQMPVMNGYQAARAIRAIDNPRQSHIPIIALSANTFEEDKRMSWESGMNAHMAKPFNLPELLGLIVKILTRAEQ